MILNTKLKYHSSDRTIKYMFDRITENTQLHSQNMELISQLEQIKNYVSSQGIVIPHDILLNEHFSQSPNV
jgi:hypothetical protein